LSKTSLDLVHQASSQLIGKPIALKDDRIVIIQWFNVIHVMPKAGDKILKCAHGVAQCFQSLSYLSGGKASQQGGLFSFEISNTDAKLCTASIGHPIHVESW